MFSLLFKTLKTASRPCQKGGFTLTELLVAGALTATVVGASGVGLASIISSSTNSGNQNEQRIELNRSLDFIAAEVRQAEKIEPNAAADLKVKAPEFVEASGKVPVLTLKVPGVSERVIYYVAAATGPWRGPQVVYRWGPDFNSNGGYANANDPKNWKEQPLIDLISDEVVSKPNCESGWSPSPSNPTGFYTCVSPTGKIASVHANGHLRKILGQDETYSLETKVATRITPTASSPPPTLTPSVPTTISRLSTVTISNLGGAIQCGSNKTLVPVSGKVAFNSASNGSKILSLPDAPNPPLTEEDVSPDTILTITGEFNNCGRKVSVNSDTDQGRQVLVLNNGDTLPVFTPFSEQKEIATVLDAINPIGGQPYLKEVTDAKGKTTLHVSLAPNQSIFFFELGVDYDSKKAMNNQEAGFDMQDLIVVATITPSTETTSTQPY
ncbi:MAG: hypothetical protein WA902_02965 [Thermosynechococcaceae cyanobacterium]